jgi:hypothetical protein
VEAHDEASLEAPPYLCCQRCAALVHRDHASNPPRCSCCGHGDLKQATERQARAARMGGVRLKGRGQR